MTAPLTSLLTYDDLLTIPEDGLRRELIDGALIVSPAPVPDHQTVVLRLIRLVDGHALATGDGEIIPGPVDVKLSDTTIVVPDLIYISNERRAEIVGKTNIIGAPDLVVEVISPSSRQIDQVRKHRIYERFGVPEYWIVNTQKRYLSVYTLVDGRYERVPAHADGRITSVAVPGLIVDPASILRPR